MLIVGTIVFVGVIYGVFAGRPFSDQPCSVQDCFESRQLEAATAFAAALFIGSFLGTRVETVWLNVRNRRALEVALHTDEAFLGHSTQEVQEFLDQIPAYLSTSDQAARALSVDLTQPLVALPRATRSAYAQGDALTLTLYSRRAHNLARARLAVAPIRPLPAILDVVTVAISLLLARKYMASNDFAVAWKPLEPIFGSRVETGLTAWSKP